MKKLVNLLLIFASLVVISCGSKKQEIKDAEIDKLEALASSDPSKQNQIGLIGTIFRKGNEQKTAKEQEAYFEYGLETCEKLKFFSERQSFLVQLIKCCYRSEETPKRLAQLSILLKESGKTEIPLVINNALWRNFKSSPEAQKVVEGERTIDIDAYIKSFGESAFDAAGSTGLKQKEAIEYIDLCEAIAMADPNNAEAPNYLWKGAEMARTLGSVDKCIALYESLSKNYPKNEKAPDALFVKGYILETNYNDKANAKLAYQKFIQDYPKHELVKDAKFLLENIDKTDDELLKMIPK